jgi:hypothetical protein
MKALTRRSLIAIAIAVAMTSGAGAGNDENGKQCDVTTLKGSYVLTASGFTIVGGVPQPKAIVELIDFNGDGTLTVTGGTVSLNGTVIPIAPNGVGDYTLGPDCNGTLVFIPIPGPTFSIVVETDGKSGWVMQTNQNNVFPGTLTRRK